VKNLPLSALPQGEGPSTSQRAEERPYIFGQYYRLLQGGEVAAAWHLSPALDIEGALAPLSGRSADLLREDGHSRGHDHSLALLHGPRVALGLVVQPGGRVDAPRDPVEGDGREELVLGKAALDITVAVTPGTVLFHDPGRQPRWRVVEPVGQRLGLGTLDVRVAPFGLEPGFTLVQEYLFSR